MMNDREKSDPSTVAAKPANKTRRSDAESAEPREGAKGNTSEPHTHRTQSRASVSPGLERVRERARQGKKERFTALLQHVTVDLLRTANQLHIVSTEVAEAARDSLVIGQS